MSRNLKFIVSALIAGAVLTELALDVALEEQPAFWVRLALSVPLMAANRVDSGWFFSRGRIAFLTTLAVQWAVLGWLASVFWTWIFRKKKINRAVP